MITQQNIDCVLISINDIQNSRGQSCLLRKLCHSNGGRWIFLRWFQDKGIAASDRKRIHPEGHHHWEVKRGNAGNNAKRLEFTPRINIRTHISSVLAFQELRSKTGIFDIFDTSTYFPYSIMTDLPVLAANQSRQFIRVRF